MKTILDYLVLPREITTFERSYLARLNRIALVFFWAHVPALAIVALLSGMPWLRAILYTSVLLVGPTLAYRSFENPRSVAHVFAFTAMCMGGLLVHFGQGPMQIEMHFYFFSLLAILAVYANPTVILTAAVTVAVHHLLLFVVLPSSVFNHEASYWTVSVHALFVVLESSALFFVARSFFDNVIGLERIVAARTREVEQRRSAMQLLLDSVSQGFMSVDLSGRPSGERSAMVTSWLGEPGQDARVWDYFVKADPKLAQWFELSWGELAAGELPEELLLEQLPKRLSLGGKSLEIEYTPVREEGVFSKVAMVISDVTARVERERAEEHERELLSLLSRLRADRSGVLAFLSEATDLAGRLADPRLAHSQDTARTLHTLKGNCGLFGLTSVARRCHALEDRLAESPNEPLDPDAVEALAGDVARANERVRLIVGEPSSRLEVAVAEHERVVGAVLAGVDRGAVARMLEDWKLEPVERRLALAAEHVEAVASRLGKRVDVDLAHDGMRLDPVRWSPFWAAFVHAVRNAADHGVEDEDERTRAGKSAAGRVTLRAAREGKQLVVEVRDDGRGVDWDAVKERATKLGLATSTRADLERALFADGLTTRVEVTEISGRGVGMGALRDACASLGGTIEVRSELGRGTTFRFVFPAERSLSLPPARASFAPAPN